MSIIALSENVAGTTTVVNRVELGRQFIRSVTVSAFSAAAFTGLVAIRISNHGNSVLPVLNRGAANEIHVDNHFPVNYVINKELTGAPFEVEIEITNPNAGAVDVDLVFETYNTPYPQTRIKEPEGFSLDSPETMLAYVDPGKHKRER